MGRTMRLAAPVFGTVAALVGAGTLAAGPALGAPGGQPPVQAVAQAEAAIPSGGRPVDGRPLAHTSRGTVFADQDTGQVAVLSDDGQSSTLVAGIDPSAVTQSYGCGNSVVLDEGDSVQWNDVGTGSSSSLAANGRLVVGATPDGWAELDLGTYKLFKVSGSTHQSTEIAASASWGYACDSTGYAYMELTDDGTSTTTVMHRCTWSGGEASCSSLATNAEGEDILAVSGATVVYESVSLEATSNPFKVWRVTQGSSPTLVDTSAGDTTSAAITSAGTAFVHNAAGGSSVAGFTTIGGSASTWTAPGDGPPLVAVSGSGAILASVGLSGGISTLGAGGLGAVRPWWMVGTPPYLSITPNRVLDTRYGIGASKRMVRKNETVRLKVTGTKNIASSGVSAVVLNVTVVNPTNGGYVTAYPSNASRPATSNLNFSRNQIVANQVITKVGPDGVVNLFVTNPTNLVADAIGWFPDGSTYVPLTPARILDTRTGNGAAKGLVPARGTRTVTALNRGGVPPSGVDSVVVNLTDTASLKPGYITAYPTGVSRPTVSNVNYKRGQTYPGLAIVKVGTGGAFNLYTYSASHLIADVVGYFPQGSDYTGLKPSRILDTRTGNGAPKRIVSGGHDVVLQVTGRGGVPATQVSAVMLNMTITGATKTGYMTVYPSGQPRPNASTLNYVAGDTLANSVLAKLGPGGTVTIHVTGTTHVIADVSGYFSPPS